MNVLSLFDGISCGQLALQKAGINVDKYYASEIKDIAIKVTQANFPNTIQLGDVRKIDLDKLNEIDIDAIEFINKAKNLEYVGLDNVKNR